MTNIQYCSLELIINFREKGKCYGASIARKRERSGTTQMIMEGKTHSFLVQLNKSV